MSLYCLCQIEICFKKKKKVYLQLVSVCVIHCVDSVGSDFVVLSSDVAFAAAISASLAARSAFLLFMILSTSSFALGRNEGIANPLSL